MFTLVASLSIFIPVNNEQTVNLAPLIYTCLHFI
uniref:Uncharacterized protein n=1 Tax=Anguilla anguilla TaxID=7936 RepID=A0A0E9QUS7_ANGAN